MLIKLIPKQIPVFWDTIKFSHVALSLIPEILNAIDVISFVSKQL
jgi:hypothetical protein